MSQQELLNKVVAVLNENGVEYMLTGSAVSSLQGEPRASHDIDVVVVMAPEHLFRFLQAFPAPDFYLSEEAMRDALRSRSMFNLLSWADGEKVDFWLLTDEPFDKSRFSRRKGESVLGTTMMVSAPEDTILMKLRWAKLSGGSDKQFTDALRVYEVQRANLDLAYLKHWVSQLGVEDLWERLQREAEPL